MKEKEIKAQIKSIFESENFESATIKSEELFKQLEELKGKRSVSALKASLKKQYQGNVRIEKEEDLEPEPKVEEPAVQEQEKEEPFRFDVNQSENFSNESVKSLLAGTDPILMQFCIVREYFKRVSDTETERSTRMFVKSDGSGYEKYDDGSAAAKTAKIQSFRKLGYFENSADGFPVGEEYCQITVMRIKKALEKFVRDRQGITRIVKVESVESYTNE